MYTYKFLIFYFCNFNLKKKQNKTKKLCIYISILSKSHSFKLFIINKSSLQFHNCSHHIYIFMIIYSHIHMYIFDN